MNKDLGSLITQINKEIQDLTSQMQEEWPQMGMMEIEQRHKEFSNRITRMMLEYNLNAIANQIDQSIAPGEMEFVSYRDRKIKTPFGEVKVRRRYYWNKEKGEGWAPFDEHMGIDGNYSPLMRSYMIMIGVEAPFDRAAGILNQMTGQDVSGKAVQIVCEKRGKEIEEEEKEKAEEAWKVFEGPSCADVENGKIEKDQERWKEYMSDEKPKRFYLQVDGGRVNTRDGWKEPKVGVIFNQEDKIKISKDREVILKKEYIGTMEGVEQFEKLIWLKILQRGGLNAEEKVIISDGARWVDSRIVPLLPDSIQILDWAHAVEHLWDVGKVLYDEEKEREELERWVKELEDLLWDGKVEEVIERLEKTKMEVRGRKKKEALEKLIGYYRYNKDKMRYDRYRKKGLMIGSGVVESGVKNVVNQRMKGCGMRWSKEGAESMIFLRCRYLSGSLIDGEVRMVA